MHAPFSLALCICTMDRPEVLRRCLASIVGGESLPDEIIVSDDSPNGEASKAVCETFVAVRYMRGPQTGLCANRNVVIRAATTDYVALLDDDALVSETFVVRAREAMSDLAENAILTGSVLERGKRIVAGDTSFWGHFTDACAGQVTNVNLNCNVFPRHAFRDVSFDEHIGYGYEDMDLCSHLMSLGFSIKYDALLMNLHMPPPQSKRVQRERLKLADRARFYTSVKRYLLWEKNIAKCAAYILLAPLHRVAHAVKVGNWWDLPCCVSDMWFALATTLRERSRLAVGLRFRARVLNG
jgi:glycosyltransferase involved in cell wall biosynthesis